MAVINGRVLFVTTSPRTPEKMIPELELLDRLFSGNKWDSDTQKSFMRALREEDFFRGRAAKNPAFSARDRINRAPQSYGFVRLSPTVELTPVGRKLIGAGRTQELFFRQLLKFQLPSPYHKIGARGAKFRVKPFLEIFRLIRHFDTLTFDELQIFGLQLTDYKKFDNVVAKIEQFRSGKDCGKESYKKYRQDVMEKEIRSIYSCDIRAGKIKIRENKDQ